MNITAGKVKATAVVGVATVLFLSTIEYVPNGHRGIRENKLKGVVEHKLYNQGVKFFNPPFVKVTDFPIYEQVLSMTSDERKTSKEDESFLVSSKDGKQLSIGVEMTYQYKEDMLTEIYQKYGNKKPRQIEEYHLKGKIKAWCSEVTTQYPVIELYGEKKTEATEKVKAILKERFGKEGIDVLNFEFVEIIPDEQSMIAINKRVNASQELETAKKLQERKIVEANTIKKEKEIESEAKIIEAEGVAKARKIHAEAEREANRLLNETITPKVLDKKWIDKWDGKLPTTQAGNTPIMTIPTK